MNQEEEDDDAGEENRGYFLLIQQLKLVSGLGMVVVLAAGLFFGVGLLLERYFNTGATGIGLCVLAGVVLALFWANRQVARVLAQMTKQAQARELRRLRAESEAASVAQNSALADKPEQADRPEVVELAGGDAGLDCVESVAGNNALVSGGLGDPTAFADATSGHERD